MESKKIINASYKTKFKTDAIYKYRGFCFSVFKDSSMYFASIEDSCISFETIRCLTALDAGGEATAVIDYIMDGIEE